jgi:uncharacterized membrane protein YfcA
LSGNVVAASHIVTETLGGIVPVELGSYRTAYEAVRMLTEIMLLLAGGFVAGTLGGLLGIGGGVVLMPMLRFWVGLPPAQAAGVCIVAVFFTTLGGSYRHYRLGHVDLHSLAPVIVSGLIATVVSSLLFMYLTTRERWLDLGIGLVLSLVSLRMIAEGIPGVLRRNGAERAGTVIEGSLPKKVSVGFLAGVLPGLLGIGTGAILVPTFAYVFSAPIKVAMASSLSCFSVNALTSAAFKFGQGFVDIDVAWPVCIGTLAGANLGARLNKAFSSRVLRVLFGLIFSYVSLKFILEAVR